MSSRLGLSLFLAASLTLSSGAAQAQGLAPAKPKAVDRSAAFRAAEAAEQAMQLAVNGDLGLPSKDVISASSPANSMFNVDRTFVNQDPPGTQEANAPVQVKVTIPAGVNGTGTALSEILYYQLPMDYVAGDPRPMVIAWHGYGVSANSVQLQSTIDEECNARGWIYLAVTGIDDVVFGSPVSQQHAEAAIKYMTTNFSVDADRLYMVGFSMGAGVVANFASRHRDPAGIMIAALGMVCTSMDWTETYILGNGAVKTLMENMYNFGGSISTQPFRYVQASTLHHSLVSYPPAPGVVESVPSMGDNLDSIPVYMTWDTGDTLPENPPVMSVQLEALINSVSGSIETHPVSGTLDPVMMTPAPHSWAVLNEIQLFDFFAPKTVVRSPTSFKAQYDRDATVGFATLTQAVPNSFSFLDGSSAGGTLSIDNVSNAATVVANVGVAGFSGVWPLHVVAHSVDGLGFSLRLTGFNHQPSYLAMTSDESLVTGVESDPSTNSLIVHVPANGTLDVQVIDVPWLSKLSSTPDPVSIGAGVTLNLNAPHASSVTSFLVVSTAELYTPIKDAFVITASVLPPSSIVAIPLNGNGDFSIPTIIPLEPALQGLRVVLQAVTLKPNGHVDTVSNLWGLHVQ